MTGNVRFDLWRELHPHSDTSKYSWWIQRQMRRATGMGLWLLNWAVGALALVVLVLAVPFAWSPDREVKNAAELWENVCDSAGFTAGEAPDHCSGKEDGA